MVAKKAKKANFKPLLFSIMLPIFPIFPIKKKIYIFYIYILLKAVSKTEKRASTFPMIKFTISL